MIKGKTIFIAHNWSDVSVAQQSKALALQFSRDNKVVFLNAKKNCAANKFINENLQIVEWPGARPTGFKDLLFAAGLVRKHKPDIIVSNFAANNIMLFVSWLYSAKVRACYFHTMVSQHLADHGNLSLSQRLKVARKAWLFNKATHLLPCSTAAKKDLLRYYKLDGNKMHVFPNALYDREVVNTGIGQTIGYIGRLARSKGVDILIDAFALVSSRFPTARLLIAGKGEAEEELRARVSKLGIGDKVDWKGAVPYDQVLSFVSQLSVLVVPSRMDNLPTVVLEAFSTHTPVIGARRGGIPDMIQHGKNGMLFEGESVEDLASCIEKMLDDERLRKELGENARTTFKEKYCIDNLRERFEALLADTIN